jgi:hypothetical protein
VHGLPKGLEEIKNNLTSLIKDKLEFVLPGKITEKFKGYNFKAEAVLDGKLFRGSDPSYTLPVSEIDIMFDKSGQLKTILTKAPRVSVKSAFFYSPKSWSSNKLVLDKMVLTSKQGEANLTTINELDYMNVNGIGFPAKIIIKNIIETLVPKTDKTKEHNIKNENHTTISFVKYEVNTGIALRFINNGILK